MTINDYTSEAINRFLSYLRDCGRSENTLRAYRADLLCFATWLKPGTRLPVITTKHLNSFLTASRGGRVQNFTIKSCPRTCNRKLSSLRVFFTWLTREEIVSKNPAINIDFISYKKGVPPWLTRGQVANLMHAAKRISPLNHMIFHLLYYTAVRRAELAKLSIADINFATHTITVYGKGDKINFIPLLPEEMKPISRYITTSAPRPPIANLLLTEQGKELNTKYIYDRVTRISARAGIPCTPHTLRRSRATHLLNAGMGMVYVRELLGHASIKTTEGYAMTPRDAVRRAYDRIAPKLLPGQTP